jgi:DNA-3-methyladenine glycosylase II
VRAWLLGIKGIGAWSADFVLLRGLGRMQQLHIARESLFEKRMSDAVSKVYANGKRLSGKEILNLAERYGEWQGYWAYYLRMTV